MAHVAQKVARWLWVGVFYASVLIAGVVLVFGGAATAAFGLEVLRSTASWHLVGGIAFVAAGVAAFVGGAVLLLRITHIVVPGRLPADNADARPVEYYRYPDAHVNAPGDRVHHQGGGGGTDSGGGAGS